LDALNSVDLNTLQSFISAGNASSMPNDLVLFLELLEIARSLYNKYESRDFIVKTLMSPVYGLSRYLATQVYFDALNFFYADNSVKQQAWANIYADHMDRLALYAIERDEIENARRCFKDAATFRGVGSDELADIPDHMKQRPIIIYSMDPAKVGLPSASRKELSGFIDNIPEISERERVRIKAESGVTDVSLFEDFLDEKNQSS